MDERIVMGRKKSYLDFTRDSRKRRKIRGKEIVLVLLILVLAIGAGYLVFSHLRERIQNIPPETELTGTPTPEGEKEIGPYGMWEGSQTAE